MMLYNCITQYCVTCFLDCAMLHHVMLHFILLFLVSHSVSHCITYTKMGQLLWRIVSCYTRHCIYHISFKTYMLRLDISWYYFAWYSVPLLKHKCIISCVYSRTHAQCHMNVWCELTLICHESIATLLIQCDTIQYDTARYDTLLSHAISRGLISWGLATLFTRVLKLGSCPRWRVQKSVGTEAEGRNSRTIVILKFCSSLKCFWPLFSEQCTCSLIFAPAGFTSHPMYQNLKGTRASTSKNPAVLKHLKIKVVCTV